jgi:hypothetical protein
LRPKFTHFPVGISKGRLEAAVYANGIDAGNTDREFTRRIDDDNEDGL